MPIYDFQCPRGHTTERRAKYGRPSIVCPECSQPAFRVEVNEHQMLITETGVRLSHNSEAKKPNGHWALDRFLDAAGEIDHQYAKIEKETGQVLPRPACFEQGIQLGLQRGS